MQKIHKHTLQFDLHPHENPRKLSKIRVKAYHYHQSYSAILQ